jgi:hypothetical protein
MQQDPLAVGAPEGTGMSIGQVVPMTEGARRWNLHRRRRRLSLTSEALKLNSPNLEPRSLNQPQFMDLCTIVSRDEAASLKASQPKRAVSFAIHAGMGPIDCLVIDYNGVLVGTANRHAASNVVFLWLPIWS